MILMILIILMILMILIILIILMILMILIDATTWRIDLRGTSVVNSKSNNAMRGVKCPSKLLQNTFLAWCVFNFFFKITGYTFHNASLKLYHLNY